MKQTLLALLLSFLLGTGALAQTPSTSPARFLTPAEQRQKEKIDREVQRERQIRAEWLQKQRDYEAKQAEKERQRAAKKAGKPIEPASEVAKPAAVPATPAPVVNQPSTTEPAPTVVEPTRKEKREKRKKEAVPEPTSIPATVPAEEPAPIAKPAVEAPATAPRPERVKRERKPKSVDSVAVVQEAGRELSVSRPTQEFLPKGHLFEPILLDPLEAQTYGSVLPGYWTEGQKYKGSIVPFAFGFAKPFYRRTTEPGRSEEWVLDLASFTQFEAYHDYTLGKARRQIINTDYKISIIYNVRRGENNYRFRVYHLSSHLGDDYIYRNQITAPSPNSVNYELLDATYSRTVNNWRLYGGLGVVLRKTEERKPFSAQLGAFYKKQSTHAARLVGGVDIKFWQQTDFRPGIHGGIGVELGRTQNNLTFLFEGYSGFRPYSQFEQQQTTWLGIGLYLNPF
ncbi:DUF1207 domain-containing protein [Spirosoma pollinicola]|uniref:DUF1207 domain-containing protein n=1 Tax=Spirosoma pollinicola TaxID=2057025 RepID=A0A2K8Z5Z6_9BACT|nr:DUF1207 domain-containing protein [Spirosoma pollinicola]AUD05254.1 DUF1207 domain-containing protein [Spirosoma pollinicola]